MRADSDTLDQVCGRIPVDDPEAALRFCQSMARALEGQKTATGSFAPGARRGTMSGEARPELSVVLPVFNEQENLISLHRRLTAVLDAEGMSYDLVFVDDGSSDGSTALLHKLASDDPRVMVIELARNFGH